MTIKRAEHLTGYEVCKLDADSHLVTFGAFNGDELVAKASGQVDWMALRKLVEQVYKLHSQIVMQRAGWRCHVAVLGDLAPHHRKYRSHGETHQIDN